MCTHYGETNHTKTKCYDLIGYPDWWDLEKESHKHNLKPKHQASVVVTKPSNDIAKAFSLIATSGNTGKVFYTSVSSSSGSSNGTDGDTWIVDCRAQGSLRAFLFGSPLVIGVKHSILHLTSLTIYLSAR